MTDALQGNIKFSCSKKDQWEIIKEFHDSCLPGGKALTALVTQEFWGKD